MKNILYAIWCYVPITIICGGLLFLMLGSILDWRDPGYTPETDPDPNPCDTVYIDRVIYDTLFVIDDGSGWGHVVRGGEKK